MNDIMRKWMLRTARKNLWRVADVCDLDDLIQDGFLCYQIVRQRYPLAVDPPHIMRLFQTVYTNHLHDLARYHDRFLPLAPDYDGGACSTAKIEQCLVEAPPLVRAAIAVFERGLTLPPYRTMQDGSRETVNERLCRLLGVDQDVDVHQAVFDYLKSK